MIDRVFGRVTWYRDERGKVTAFRWFVDLCPYCRGIHQHYGRVQDEIDLMMAQDFRVFEPPCDKSKMYELVEIGPGNQ